MAKFKARAVLVWEFEAGDKEAAQGMLNEQLNMIELDSGDEYKGYTEPELQEQE